MKKKEGYLKLCNEPFEDEAKKFKKRAIVISIIIALIEGSVAVMLVLSSLK